MSTDVAARIIFGDSRDSFVRQNNRVRVMRAAIEGLELRFLAAVRDRATRPDSSVSHQEKQAHSRLRLSISRARQQLAEEVKMLQWLRRRHNMAVLHRQADPRHLVF
ncbi:hypothetical protein GGF46_000731 [Coemansia sp. RSA 552]|nr:hypothetical protein GGF46_000731 [Coemansia sp. RSA 552]